MPSFMARIRNRFEQLSPNDFTDDRLRLSIDSAAFDDSVYYTPQDVTTISSPSAGQVAYNDGTVGTAGPAHYDGSSWISTVDGTTIA